MGSEISQLREPMRHPEWQQPGADPHLLSAWPEGRAGELGQPGGVEEGLPAGRDAAGGKCPDLFLQPPGRLSGHQWHFSLPDSN